MGWDLVVIRWFCELWYGVVRFEGDSNVSVFVKVAHFGLLSVLVGVWCALFCVLFGVLICKGG